MKRLHDGIIWCVLLLLIACGASSAPIEPTVARAQVQDTNEITQNTEVIYTFGSVTVIATIYDFPDTEQNGDMICQTVINNFSSASVAMDCQIIMTSQEAR